jgi:cyanate permease
LPMPIAVGCKLTDSPGNGTTSLDRSSSRYRFVIGGLVLLAHTALGLTVFAPSPLMPLIIDEYSINRSTAGLLLTLPLLVTAGIGLPGGILVSRLGLRMTFTIGWSLVGLVALSALAPNFGTLLTIWLAKGVGTSLILMATGPLLMQWFKPREILVVNGLTTAGVSLGIALSVFTAAPLAGVLGWLPALTVFGSVGAVGAVVWVVLSRPVGGAVPLVPIVSPKELWSILSNRAILLLVIADAGAMMQYTALTGWLPSFLNEVRGMSLNQAGFITGLLPFVGIFAVLLGGVLPSRIGAKRAFLMVPGLLLVLSGPGTYLFGNLWVIYLSVVVLGVGSWLYLPTLLSLPMEMPGVTPEKVAVIWGFLITFSGFSMFFSPQLVGGIRDLTGSFTIGFIICSVGAWTLLISGVLMPRSALQRRSAG